MGGLDKAIKVKNQFHIFEENDEPEAVKGTRIREMRCNVKDTIKVKPEANKMKRGTMAAKKMAKDNLNIEGAHVAKG